MGWQQKSCLLGISEATGDYKLILHVIYDKVTPPTPGKEDGNFSIREPSSELMRSCHTSNRAWARILCQVCHADQSEVREVRQVISASSRLLLEGFQVNPLLLTQLSLDVSL